MAVTLNAKGTSFPSFTVGKNGATIYQGTSLPNNSNGNAGDFYIYVNGSSSEFFQKQGSVWSAIASGGNVTGPLAATDTAIAIYDGTTGQLIKNTGVLIDVSNNVSGLNDLTANGTISGSNLSGSNTGDQLYIAGSGTATASGLNSLAGAGSAVASGTNTLVIGFQGTAAGTASISIGAKSLASETISGGTALAIGYNGSATGYNSIVIGGATIANARSAIAIGHAAIGSGPYSLAICDSASALGSSAISIGNTASAAGTTGIAIGYVASAGGLDAIAIGSQATASGTKSISIGNNTASATGQVIIGYGTGTLNLTSAGVLTAANLSGTNTGDQTITLTGDVTGSGTGSFATTLANSGIIAGTYNQVVFNAKGLATSGTTLNYPVGPATSTNNAIATYNGSTGGSLQDTSVTIDSNSTITNNKNSSNVRCSEYILWNTTTGTTQTELFLDGNSIQLTLPNNTTMHFEIQLVGRRTGAAGSNFVASYSGAISKDGSAATTALIGDITEDIATVPNTLDWTAAVSADAINGALRILVTGDTSTNITWGAVIKTMEITG